MTVPAQQSLRNTKANRRTSSTWTFLLSMRSLAWLVAGVVPVGCGGGSSTSGGGSTTVTTTATPVISAAAAQNGAQVVTLTDSASGAAIYFTTDGSAPTAASQMYEAPFLVDSNLTLNVAALAAGESLSAIAKQSFSPNIASGTLVWSDEFNNTTGANIQPNEAIWKYQTGGNNPNSELEVYCGYNSSTSPCNTATPNSYVGTDGYLHIIAQQPTAGVYTSARLYSQGLFSFQYGRLEFRALVPEAQGLWPAAWLMGNSIATINWPACGEQDVMERVDAALTPDWNEGSIHGPGFTGSNLGTRFNFPAGETAAQWHTYGMIWSPGSVSYYVDDPSTPYATFTPSSIAGYSGSSWPFDAGQNFLLLNMAVGGDYPGSPNSSTPFPSEMLVDYVRIYTN